MLVSSNASASQCVLRAAGCMLAVPLLCGCFFHGDVPPQPIPQTPAAHDPPQKGLIRGPSPASSDAAGTTPADTAKAVGTRGLLLRGGWYRAPITAEEPVGGVYSEALVTPDTSGKPEKASSPPIVFHYRHAGLEQFLARPADERTLPPGLLADSDRNVAATAAVALARQGDARAAGRLLAAIKNEELPLPARCAAVEALGQLPGDDQVETLRKLIDRYGQFAPGGSTGYLADLHAELLRALARHIDAADDPRFISASDVPSALVRIELLRAWAAGTRGPIPSEIVDLRSDDDSRVRAAAMTTLAARKHPAARDFLTTALRDIDLQVRLTAVRGLGRLDDPQAAAVLNDLLKDRSELIRAEAVAAIALRGSRAVVLGMATDPSWRVRLRIAEALAAYGDRDGSAVAGRLLDDPSAEVERQVVRSLTAWPWEIAGPVLLDALGKDAVSVRKLAAQQLAARWPAGGRFPFDALPARRAEALGELRSRYLHEFGAAHGGVTAPANPQSPVIVSDAQVERLLAARDFTALAKIGPTVVNALERLATDRKFTLPEPVYHEVLPRHSPVYATLDRMHGANVESRRRAAEELAGVAGKQPLSGLAVARLCELSSGESDAAVWLSVLAAVRDNGSEAAVRMARLALGQASPEVRRRGCEHLCAHPDPAHEVFLLPLLGDSEQEVVIAAIRALGAAGQIQDIEALKRQFASANEEVQLETAVALLHFRDRSGEDALERLSYSSDIKTRARVAQALGTLGDAHFAGILIRLLDDPKATVSHAALASLPKVVGHDLRQPGDGVTVSTVDQMARWKKWYAETAK